jgi:uncharacterized protein (TIGR03083 family)
VLTRSEVIDGTLAELEAFGVLVRSLDDAEWATPTRCTGWTVADVAGHLVGAFADILAGRLEGQGTDEVSQRQAAERRGRSPREIADEIDTVLPQTAALLSHIHEATWGRSIPGVAMTVGQGWGAMWTGTYIHADDIRAAIGRPPDRGAGLRATVHHVAELLAARGWGPATLDLEGLEEIAIAEGAPAPRVTGDALAFALVATGRADPALLGLDESVNVYA